MSALLHVILYVGAFLALSLSIIWVLILVAPHAFFDDEYLP